MNLRKNEALKMQVETLQGIDYLLIETGGFNAKGGQDCKSLWMAMKRQ